MATFKMEIDGEELSFPSEEHAARFFLAKQRIAASAEVPRHKKVEKAAASGGVDLTTALVFLDLIQAGGEHGANSKDVMKALDVAGGRGIGSKLTPTKKLLKELGFEHKTVFFRHRVPRVGRFWKGGPKLNAAYDAVKRKINGG